jgi:hypothetical protein
MASDTNLAMCWQSLERSVHREKEAEDSSRRRPKPQDIAFRCLLSYCLFLRLSVEDPDLVLFRQNSSFLLEGFCEVMVFQTILPRSRI